MPDSHALCASPCSLRLDTWHPALIFCFLPIKLIHRFVLRTAIQVSVLHSLAHDQSCFSATPLSARPIELFCRFVLRTAKKAANRNQLLNNIESGRNVFAIDLPYSYFLTTNLSSQSYLRLSAISINSSGHVSLISILVKKADEDKMEEDRDHKMKEDSSDEEDKVRVWARILQVCIFFEGELVCVQVNSALKVVKMRD